MGLDLDDFQKSIFTRSMVVDDFDQVVAIQKACFPDMTPWTPAEFESHLRHFPEGQICVEYQGRIVGSSSSLMIDFDEYGNTHSWDEICDGGYISNHDPEGDTLYGIEVMVDPEFRGMRIGRRLYDARKELARQLNVKRILVGGRVPNYHKYAEEMDIHMYVEQVISKKIYDPVLTFQLANGFVLKRILKAYFDEDEKSKGFALFLEWVNLHYRPQPAERTLSSFPVRVCSIQYQMRKISSFDDFAQQCEFFVDVAAAYQSDFAIFPEIFTLQLLSFLPQDRPGVTVRRLTKYTKSYLDLFQHLAIKYAVNIVGGSHYTEEDDHLYNVAYLFKRDGGIEKQYKLHITPNERRWWGIQPGNVLNIMDTDRGKVSIQICYDVEFPELGRMATQHGARMFLVPFCTDERHGFLRVQTCAKARAVENQVYVATAGCVGNIPSVENIDIHYAQSGIYAPLDFPFATDGIAGECQPNIETVVVADLDLEILKRNRLTGTVQTWNDRRKDLYEVVEKLAVVTGQTERG